MGKEKSDKIPCFINYRIIHHGNVEINELFNSLPGWFDGFRYDYWEKGQTQKDIGTGMEYMSDWTAEREINDYVKFTMMFTMFIKHMNKVKVNGKEMINCHFELYLSSTVEKNYKEQFGKDWFQKTLKHIYERYVRYQDLLTYEDKLCEECVDLVNLIKSRLK